MKLPAFLGGGSSRNDEKTATASGGPKGTFNVPINVPENCGVECDFEILGANSATVQALYLMYSGGYVVNAKGWQDNGSHWVGITAYTLNASPTGVHFTIGPTNSRGVRRIEGTFRTEGSDLYSLHFYGTMTAGALTSIGLGAGGDPLIADGSKFTAKLVVDRTT